MSLREYLISNPNWITSEYNEETSEQLDYYINERQCSLGDTAYIYSHEDKQLDELKIVKLISRTDDMEMYDKLVQNEDALLDGEREYNADTSAEFISDNDCYLIWFKYV